MSEFPELSEQGKEQAQALVDKFKKRMTSVANEVLGNLYTDVLIYIETDAWTNYRENIRVAMENKYRQNETATSEDAWARSIREAIYVQFKDELEKGIIADLNKRIKFLEECLESRNRY